MNKIERYLLRRIIGREVRQGISHRDRITELYKMIQVACEQEFYEDNGATLNTFLSECFENSLGKSTVMTVPVERTNSVVYTREFLCELLDAKKTPRVPKIIRERAYALLRHYPSESEMDIIATREDGDEKFKIRKIFGKSFL